MGSRALLSSRAALLLLPSHPTAPWCAWPPQSLPLRSVSSLRSLVSCLPVVPSAAPAASLPCGLFSPFLRSPGRTLWPCLLGLLLGFSSALPRLPQVPSCGFEPCPNTKTVAPARPTPGCLPLLSSRRTSSAHRRQRRCFGPCLLCSSVAARWADAVTLRRPCAQRVRKHPSPFPGRGLVPLRGPAASRPGTPLCAQLLFQSELRVTPCQHHLQHWRRSRALSCPQEPPASSGLPSPPSSDRLRSTEQPRCLARVSPGFCHP